MEAFNAGPQPQDAAATRATPTTVPPIVLAVTMLPAVIALALAVAGTGATYAFAEDAELGFRGGLFVFSAFGAITTGQEISVVVGTFALSESLAIAIAPFGLSVLTAWLLTRMKMSRGWVKDAPPLIGAVAGIVSLLLVAVLFRIVANFGGEVTGSGFSGRLEVGLQPLIILVAGALPWLLAWFAVQSRARERAFQAFLVLSALFVIAVLFAGVQGDAGAGALVTALVGSVLLAPNLVAIYAPWPFGGSIAAMGSGASQNLGWEFADTSFAAATGDSGWAWLLPLAVIAVIAAAAWFDEVADGWKELLHRTGQTLAMWGALLWLLGWLGKFTIAEGAMSLGGAIGAGGLPWRLFTPLLVFAVVYAVTGWVRANRAGAGWAATSELASSLNAVQAVLAEVGTKFQTATRNATDSARGAAQSAQQQAAAAADRAPTTGRTASSPSAAAAGNTPPPPPPADGGGGRSVDNPFAPADPRPAVADDTPQSIQETIERAQELGVSRQEVARLVEEHDLVRQDYTPQEFAQVWSLIQGHAGQGG